MSEFINLKMNKVPCKNKRHLNHFKKTKMIYFQNSTFDKQNFESQMNYHENLHFSVWHIQLLLNIIGVHIPYSNKNNKHFYQNVLFRTLNCFWKFDLIILFVTFISALYNLSTLYNIHLHMSRHLLRGLILSNRIILFKNRNSYKRLLFAINKFLYIETLNKKRIKILVLFIIVSVLVFTSLSVYYLVSSLTYQDMVNMSLNNSYNFIMNKACVEFFVIVICFTWIFTYVATASVFTIIYKILSDILINEFFQLSQAIDKCINEAEGNLVIERYYKAVEIGKSIDDVNCFPIFIILVNTLISLFFDGFRQFATKMSELNQVIIYLIFWFLSIFLEVH